jgi:NAD(P)-dependent dehydrogenase (short-subunit alcohol dehydrogenase family)
MSIPPDKLEACIETLQQIADDPAVIAQHERIKSLIAKIYREGRKGKRRGLRQHILAEDRQSKEATSLVRLQRAQQARQETQDAPATPRMLNRPAECYICKAAYQELHPFYHLLCPQCAAINFAKRGQRADLSGRVALITGGRIKIGYQTALALLRDGAKVLVTTRFPHDCVLRFAGEPDFAEWSVRLHIYGLDLRNIPAVEAFVCRLLNEEPALDILINNAAQTIKRPAAFYAPQLAIEQQSSRTLPPALESLIASNVSPHPLLMEGEPEPRFPLPSPDSNLLPNSFDADGQPFDLRLANSWSLRLHEVSTIEAIEVLLVNTVAPMLLNAKLKPLMLRSSFPRRFIVNVSSMEGQFQRSSKTPYHPHTNMAKAALNMMTRTSAQDYAQDGIYMNSVDTGWITEENPYLKKRRQQSEHSFYPPLDAIDGAARIYDPIVRGINSTEEPLYGCFLKDYAAYPW